jgi:ATP-dependent helicase HrpB
MLSEKDLHPAGPLPIDAVLPELKRALARHQAAVLQAPPGAGKTTRVPLALLAEQWLAGHRIVMLEPRRLAAANAARFMAASLGEEVGRTVGYAIRFERRVSAATRIEVVTEGILTRRLQTDPMLADVGLVIFDEFHERHLHTDLALALCRDAQLGLREDLRLLIMSATLEAGPVARLLDNAPLVTSSGRLHPVAIRYLGASPRPAAGTAAAVRLALAETSGDILAFLPGAGEIRRCAALLAETAAAAGVRLCPLYGDLPFAAQQQAILPGSQRKVVLATNIAETSLTIEGVRTVVDSGLARRPRFDAAAGISRLETARISRASAEQRAGRAGRLAPGVCYRLWSAGEQESLLPFTPPEIRTGDLLPLALELARWGVADAGSLTWLDPPSPGALAGARRLLQGLGALDGQEHLTELGREMARLPAHPRLARLLAAARRAGEIGLGCDLAALLGERDLFGREHRPEYGVESDLVDRLQALQGWRRRQQLPAAVDGAACAAVDRAARHFGAALAAGAGSGWEGELTAARLARLLAPAFPDRIGMEREPGSGRYLLAGGRGGSLSARSGVKNARLLIALEVEGDGAGEARIHQASGLAAEILEELFPAVRQWRREVFWDEREEKVAARQVRGLGDLILAARPVAAAPEEATAAVLEGLRRLGLEALGWSNASRQLLARVRFLARVFPAENWPDFSDANLAATAPVWLGPLLTRVRSRAELARLEPLPGLESLLDWRGRRRLEEAAPTHLPVPSGHRIPLDYQVPEPPVMAVKLQELFGLADTPRVADGQVAVLLHLLSPARRPIQITRDLRSFWDKVYPEVKKELKGRYPKHPWPDDPWSATATRATTRKRPAV